MSAVSLAVALKNCFLPSTSMNASSGLPYARPLTTGNTMSVYLRDSSFSRQPFGSAAAHAL